MNIVTVSSLYPNNKDPKHGVFVETRIRHLIEHFPDISITVIAPVPWFPFSSSKFGEYAKFAGVVDYERRHNIDIYHPKYLVLPKIGMYLTPWFMARAIKKSLQKIINQGNRVDVIDGHYFYPDGVAIANVANELSIPFTCTARGTDINLIPQRPRARAMIKKVFKQASHMMAVCKALKDEMVAIGAKDSDVTVLRNGVDLTLFSASEEFEQEAIKKELSLQGKLILSVGWLIERKGHHLIIDAIKNLDGVTLAIAGDGPDLAKLTAQVKALNLDEKVLFLGSLNQKELNKWFKAADVTVLASSREGWANVLLESMASGTRVVATEVWGTPEVVTSLDAGVLVKRNVDDITKGIKEVLSMPSDRVTTRRYAEKFDWLSTSTGQKEIFSRIVK